LINSIKWTFQIDCKGKEGKRRDKGEERKEEKSKKQGDSPPHERKSSSGEPLHETREVKMGGVAN